MPEEALKCERRNGMDELDNRPGRAEQAGTEEAERRLEDAAPVTEEPVWELRTERRRSGGCFSGGAGSVGGGTARTAVPGCGKADRAAVSGRVRRRRRRRQGGVCRYWTAARLPGVNGAEGGGRAGRRCSSPVDRGIRRAARAGPGRAGAGSDPGIGPAGGCGRGDFALRRLPRYAWAEYRRAEEAREAAGRAAACSAGRLEDRPDQPGTEQEIFSAVFREAVK